jgi:hypothetical protein
VILERQESEGWGAKVIDRLAVDLREAFPDMKGFSPRNLKYMRAFAAAWPDRAIVQEALENHTNARVPQGAEGQRGQEQGRERKSAAVFVDEGVLGGRMRVGADAVAARGAVGAADL